MLLSNTASRASRFQETLTATAGGHNEAQTVYCVSGSARLHFDVLGDRDPAVLLLHGLGGSRVAWLDIPSVLAGSHRVIVPDLRGCGISERGTEPYSFEQLARDVIAILDAADAQSCHVIGHSFGGVLAQHLLAFHEERVASAVLVSTSSRVGEKAANGWRRLAEAVEQRGLARPDIRADRGFAAGFADRCPELVRTLQGIAANCDRGVYAAQARIAAAYDYTTALARVTRPTLILQGRADRMTSPGGSVLLARAIPTATLELIDDVGHNLHLEMGDRFVHRVTQFFADVDRRLQPAQRPPAPR